MDTIEIIKGTIVDYDERRQELVIRAPYDNFATLSRRQYKTVDIQLNDSRRLSDKQRKACYALIAAIADYTGDDRTSVKEFMKISFWTSELYQTADTMFSLSNAPMSVVASFQKFLVKFIIQHDIPTKRPMLDFVDDIEDYIYACLANKKCCVCGAHADLHHVDRVGMGRDRTDIIHEGLKVLPLCRLHHSEAHTMPDTEFIERYHLSDGIPADRTICKIYGLKGKKK